MEGRNIPSSSVTPHLTDCDSQSANMGPSFGKICFTNAKLQHQPCGLTDQPLRRGGTRVKFNWLQKNIKIILEFLIFITWCVFIIFVHLYIITQPQGAVQSDEAYVELLKIFRCHHRH